MAQAHSSSRSGSVSQVDLPPPSDKLKGLMLDSLPAHVFVALPQTGDIVWVNSRYLTYRGQTAEDLANDPWSSLHPDDRPDYLKAWSQSVRTGEQFSRTVRIRRFDGVYRYFYARAIASRDKRGVIVQFLGSYMDIHDQRVAELKAARQEEIEASEAKHRLLANLIPQIIFTATEHEGVTFANEQWLCYTGQSFEDSLGLGFIDFVHPDDLAKCRIPTLAPPTPAAMAGKGRLDVSSTGTEAKRTPNLQPEPSPALVAHVAQQLSRHNSSAGEEGSVQFDLATGDLAELAKHGVVKLATDNAGRLSYTTEVRLRDKSGEYRWHLVRCVETEKVDFGSGDSSYFGSATDIHDLKLLESKLTEAMDSKSRFLSNMSHEIRTPLIGISGMVSFLQETTLNDEQKDYTNTIQTSANSLLMIINDILDLSKVDAGMMKLNYEWFHTRSLIEDVNELVSAMAIAKKLELNYIVDEEVPAWVRGDKVRIRQVLLNVVGNAIKFTTTGEVFSRCRVVQPVGTAQLGDDEIMLEFSVIDTGRGFSKEEADLIFKRFSQIDGSSTRQHGGSGLGLVISRQLVELHGGKMEGTAVPGKGSTFTFTARFGKWTSSADRPEGQPIPTPVSEQMSAPPMTAISNQGKAALPAAAVAQILTGEPLRETPGLNTSPMTDATVASSGRTSGSGSSMPSVRSNQSQDTHRSSASSVHPQTGLANLSKFGEAASTNIRELSDMKLEMPSDKSSEGTTPTAGQTDKRRESSIPTIPPLNRGYTLYSILVISPQMHSREATVAHIEMTLPKNIPHHITALATAAEAEDMITGDDAINFTHVVINLPSPEEVIHLAAQVLKSDRTRILILSDTVQRQAIVKLAAFDAQLEHALSAQDSPDGTAAHDHRVTYIYKPVKPSRFAVIFDPAQERDISIDRNRSTAARIVETQKQNYAEMERRMGGKGYRVLLIEDNPVNQKVLKHYLKKVGVEVEIAGDGVAGTDMVFKREWGFYSLILVSISLLLRVVHRVGHLSLT
jgi:PAS domain S-box-containing protein